MATITRFANQLQRRIFTETERRRCERRANPGPSYARRFADKEAAAKALGAGFGSGVFWRDLGVVNLPSGQPGLRLTGGALKRLEAMTPPGMTARLDVTLTDEPPLAQAVVIITALPAVIPAAVPAE